MAAYDITNNYKGYANIPSMGLMCAYDAFDNNSWDADIRFENKVAAQTYILQRFWLGCDLNNDVFVSFWVPNYDWNSGLFNAPWASTEVDQYPAGISYSKLHSSKRNTDTEAAVVLASPDSDLMYKSVGVW